MGTDSREIRIRPAIAREAYILTAIVVRATAFWGYSSTWIDDWRQELNITPAYIESNPVFVVELDGAPLPGASERTLPILCFDLG
jgi:hypothetical protein